MLHNHTWERLAMAGAYDSQTKVLTVLELALKMYHSLNGEDGRD